MLVGVGPFDRLQRLDQCAGEHFVDVIDRNDLERFLHRRRDFGEGTMRHDVQRGVIMITRIVFPRELETFASAIQRASAVLRLISWTLTVSAVHWLQVTT